MWVIQAKYHQIPITISIVYCENHNYLTILITCKIITVLQHMAEYESRRLSVIATHHAKLCTQLLGGQTHSVVSIGRMATSHHMHY